MLKRKTVFVIGAGASAPYGFSTGASLLEKVRLKGKDYIAEVTGSEVDGSDARRLEAAMLETLEDSIDSMLERRTELWRPGKQLISGLLLQEEANVFARRAKIGPAVDWIAFVYQMMSSGATTLEKFLENDVTFITFNYDRLLEWRLAGGIRSGFGCDNETSYKAVTSIPIYHLHGSIGPPWRMEGVDDIAIPFGAFSGTEPFTEEGYLAVAMMSADRSIKIIHDAVPGGPAFVNARTNLALAELVVFLGFGFAKTNVERLELDRIGSTVPVICSIFSMTEAEKRRRIGSALSHHSTASIYTLRGEITEVLRETFDQFG